jgi:hypothetical protein
MVSGVVLPLIAVSVAVVDEFMMLPLAVAEKTGLVKRSGTADTAAKA